VPSSVSDSMTAFDVETGRERWRFYAQGPVRFPAVADRSRVYFVSDDGYLYCLDGSHGALLWAFRGGPDERRVLDNGRLEIVFVPQTQARLRSAAVCGLEVRKLDDGAVGCQAAIRWLRANSKKYNFDPDHIGVIGASADGHLVALLGTAGGKKAFAPIGGNEETMANATPCRRADTFPPPAILADFAACCCAAGNSTANATYPKTPCA